MHEPPGPSKSDAPEDTPSSPNDEGDDELLGFLNDLDAPGSLELDFDKIRGSDPQDTGPRPGDSQLFPFPTPGQDKSAHLSFGASGLRAPPTADDGKLKEPQPEPQARKTQRELSEDDFDTYLDFFATGFSKPSPPKPPPRKKTPAPISQDTLSGEAAPETAVHTARAAVPPSEEAPEQEATSNASPPPDDPDDSPQRPEPLADRVTEDGVEYADVDDMLGGAVPHRYIDPSLLDEGGMGKIHIAKDLNLRRRVVIKSLKPGVSDDAAFDFLREVQITAQLDHPNIVPVYNLFDPEASGGTLAFTMKLVEGETLEDIVERLRAEFQANPKAAQARERSVGLRERLEQFVKICEAIEFAHSKNVLHRDLKPDNIMVGAHGEIYVMDWGLAFSPNIGVTEPPATLAGTPRYMAPEQFKGDARLLGPDSDVFALGAILFELIALRRATVGDTIEELIVNTPKGRFNDFVHFDPSIAIHPDLAAIVNRALQIHRQFRYPDVRSLTEDLNRFLRDEEVSVRPDNLPRKIARWIGKHRMGAMITLLIVILVASGGTIWGFASAYDAAQERKRSAEQEKRVAEQEKRLAEQQSLIEKEKRERVEREKKQLQKSRVRESQISRFQAEISARAYSIDEQFARSEDQVRGLADTARLLLTHPPRKKFKLFSSEDFGDPKDRPEDVELSPIYNKEVSLDEAVYKLAPDVKWRKVKKEVRRLGPLRLHFMRMLLHSGDLARRDQPPLAGKSSMDVSRDAIRQRILVEGVPVRWAFFGLEIGVHFAYPGKGGYSPEYDPRQRPWYTLAAPSTDPESGETVFTHGVRWGNIYEDAQGQGLLIPCVSAVYNKEEEFVGVVGLDITVDDVIQHYIKREGAGFVEAFLITEAGNIIVRTGNLGAQQDIPTDAFLKGELFDNPELLEAIREQASGVIRSQRDGRDVLLGFQSLSALGWIYVEEVEARAVLNTSTTTP